MLDGYQYLQIVVPSINESKVNSVPSSLARHFEFADTFRALVTVNVAAYPAHMRRDAEQSLVTVMRMTREQHYAASTRRMVCWILRMHNARRRDAVHGLVTVMRMTREQHDAASTRRMVCWIL